MPSKGIQYRDLANARTSGHPRIWRTGAKTGQRVASAWSKGLAPPRRHCIHEARWLTLPSLRGVSANVFEGHYKTEIPPDFTNLDQKLCHKDNKYLQERKSTYDVEGDRPTETAPVSRSSAQGQRLSPSDGAKIKCRHTSFHNRPRIGSTGLAALRGRTPRRRIDSQRTTAKAHAPARGAP